MAVNFGTVMRESAGTEDSNNCGARLKNSSATRQSDHSDCRSRWWQPRIAQRLTASARRRVLNLFCRFDIAEVFLLKARIVDEGFNRRVDQTFQPFAQSQCRWPLAESFEGVEKNFFNNLGDRQTIAQ